MAGLDHRKGVERVPDPCQARPSKLCLCALSQSRSTSRIANNISLKVYLARRLCVESTRRLTDEKHSDSLQFASVRGGKRSCLHLPSPRTKRGMSVLGYEFASWRFWREGESTSDSRHWRPNVGFCRFRVWPIPRPARNIIECLPEKADSCAAALRY